MSLLTDVLKIADSVTKALKFQTTITFERFQGANAYGDETYAAGVSMFVVFELKTRNVRSTTGEEVVSSATITVVDLPATVAATPQVLDAFSRLVSTLGQVNVRDRITLADGRRPPIINTGGFVDGGTGYLIPTEIYLG